MTLTKICKFVSVGPISRSCKGHHNSPLVCVTLTKFTGLSHNLDKNLKMCVCPSHFKVMPRPSQITLSLCDLDTIHWTSDNLDQNLKMCVSVRPISMSCQGHHKSLLVCVTLTKFTGLFDNLDHNL